MVECLRELPCERSLIVSYELLGLFPQAHVARLAAFLGTSPTDERVLGWLRLVRPPNPSAAGSVRASWEQAIWKTAPYPSWEQAILPSSPSASPYKCNDTRNNVLAGKLQTEVALWRRHGAAWREVKPWAASVWHGNPFPWPQHDGARVVEPPWVRACDAEWAGGERNATSANATPDYLAARCLDAFRSALRQWFYGETDDMTKDAFPRSPLSSEPCALSSSLGSSQPPGTALRQTVWGRPQQVAPSVASATASSVTLTAHHGMTLSALAAAVKRADIRICLTVAEHFGSAGLGDTMSYRLLPLKFAIAHEPHLRYQFAPTRVGKVHNTDPSANGSSTHHGIHHTEQFDHIFASAPEGSGCKRDGSDGRKMPAKVCAKVIRRQTIDAPVQPKLPVAPIIGWSMWTLVGDGVINGSHTLHNMVKVPPWQCPSSPPVPPHAGRAWRLRAAC